MRSARIGIALVIGGLVAGCSAPPVVPDAAADDAGLDATDARVPRIDAAEPSDVGFDGFVPGPMRDATRPLAPLSGAHAGSWRPTLRWQRDAASDTAHVEVCRDRACARALASTDTAALTWTLDVDLPAGLVFWRVTGSDGLVSPTWELVVPNHGGASAQSWGTTPDFDGDGLADAVVQVDVFPSASNPAGCCAFGVLYGGRAGLDSAHSIAIVRRDSDGTLMRYDEGVGHFATPDVNGDGFSDLVVALSGASYFATLDVYLGSADGLRDVPAQTLLRSAERTDPAPVSVSAVGDLDADGYADVALIVLSTSPMAIQDLHARVLRGGPDGLVLLPTDARLHVEMDQGVVARGVGDLTGDGLGDLLLPTPTGIELHAGSATHGFETSPTTSVDCAMSFGWWLGEPGDLDGDGWPEIVASGLLTLVHVATSAAGLASSAVSQSLPHADGPGNVAGSPGDLDGDGFDDLVVSSASGVEGVAVIVRIAHGSTSGPGAADEGVVVPDGRGGGLARSLQVVGLVGDADGDGLADVVLGSDGECVLMRGRVGSPPSLEQHGPWALIPSP